MKYTYKDTQTGFAYTLFGMYIAMLYRFGPYPWSAQREEDPGAVDFIILFLLLALFLYIVNLITVEYRFTESGVTIARLISKKHYPWSQIAYCGILPKGVCQIRSKSTYDDEPYLCFSVDIMPVSGEEIPEKCYLMDDSSELGEMLRLIAPENFGKTLEKRIPSRPASAGLSLEEIQRKMLKTDLITAFPGIVSIFSCLLIPSEGWMLLFTILFGALYLVMVYQYLNPKMKELEKLKLYFTLLQMKCDRINVEQNEH